MAATLPTNMMHTIIQSAFVSENSWYGLHRVTWVVIVVVTLAALACQQAIQSLEGSGPYFVGKDVYAGRYGWPFVYYVDEIGQQNGRYVPTLLLFNLLLSLAMITSTAVVFERCIRKRTRWCQFRVRTVIMLTTVTAVLLAILQAESLLVRLQPNTKVAFEAASPYELWPHFATKDMPWPVRAPILFALGCTIYTVLSVGCSLLQEAFGRAFGLRY